MLTEKNHLYIQECIVNCNMESLGIPDSNYGYSQWRVELPDRQFVLLVCRFDKRLAQLEIAKQLMMEDSMSGMLLVLELGIEDKHMKDNSRIDHNNIDLDKPSENEFKARVASIKLY